MVKTGNYPAFKVQYNLALEKGEKEFVFLNEKYNIMTASNIIILVENTPRMMAFQLQ